VKPTTLVEKIWDEHVIDRGDADLLYIDLHLVHEVTSPQAFEGLRRSGRKLRRPDLTIATADHVVPTSEVALASNDDVLGARQLQLQIANCREFGVELHPMGSAGQGILHVIAPELGLTQPGMTIVCGDSHTATHGAFGAIAFGIGTSQVEHVMATQTLRIAKPRTMAVRVEGRLCPGTTAKDLVLAIIGAIGISGGTDTLIEYRGECIRALPMAGRMTVCNMAIEAGARSGLIAPDETTLVYLEGKQRAPKGGQWARAVEHWQTLRTDRDAVFDVEAVLDAGSIRPQATWGTNPSQTVNIDGRVPDPSALSEPVQREAARRALEYMGLEPGTAMGDIPISTVFIGSCTNGRLDDLRAAAEVVGGRRVASTVRALVVPGSARIKQQAEQEGLDKVFRAAGFEWRLPGCSMCVGINGDVVAPGMHSASTSNRNFEGRQGVDARTHLVSPESAAATAIAGHLATAASLN
jgi:3-isopropylmalate/(R)-2-methylmalate dehydratase large subunit